MRAETKNRLTVAGSIGMLMVLSAILGSMVTEPVDDRRNRPSTFFTDETGARALFLVMRQVLASVEQWRQPFQVLPDPEGDGSPNTLVVIGPGRSLSRGEAVRLEAWIQKGGQLVLLSQRGWAIRDEKTRPGSEAIQDDDFATNGERRTFLQRFGVTLTPRDFDEVRMRKANLPLPGGDEVALSVLNAAQWDGDYQVVAGSDDDPVAIGIPMGEGRIVALADPAFLSNRRLGEGDNAAWLVTLCAAWGNGRVAIDEYHHGFGKKRGFLELTLAFLGTPWGWAAAQLMAAGLVYAIVFRKRLGRVSDPPKQMPRSPLQLLEARAGLLQTAGARRLAADLICLQLSVRLDPLRGGGSDPWRTLETMRARLGDPPDGALFDRLKGHDQSIANQPTSSQADTDLFMLARTAGQLQQQHQHDTGRTKHRPESSSRSCPEYAGAD